MELMELLCGVCICVLLLAIIWSCLKELIVIICIYLIVRFLPGIFYDRMIRAINSNRYTAAVYRFLIARKDNSRRIILLGKTGTGKSSTGNTIIGMDNIFEEKDSLGSVTSTCKCAERERYGRKLLVVDTPGLYDTRKTFTRMGKEVLFSISEAEPGHHVFIFVFKIGVFSDEDYKTYMFFQDLLGDAIFKHGIILFTHRDSLPERYVQLSTLTENCIHLENILPKFKKQWIAFDNKNRMLGGQVRHLIDMIDDITNSGEKYLPSETLRQKIMILEDIEGLPIVDFEAQREEFVRRVQEMNEPSAIYTHALRAIGYGIGTVALFLLRRRLF